MISPTEENTQLVPNNEENADNNNYGTAYQEIPLDSDRQNSTSLRVIRRTPVNSNTSRSESAEYRNLCIGYIFVFLINIGYTVSLVSAQLAVGEITIWQLNFMRFAFEAAVALLMIVCGGHSVRIKRNDVHWVFIMMVTYFLYNTCYYLAPTVLPLGTMQAIFTTLLIIFTVTLDILMKSVHRVTIIAAFLCSAGLIFLIQPWDYQLNNEVYSWTLCDVWDRGCNLSFSLDTMNATCKLDTDKGRDVVYHIVNVDGTIIGYVLVVIGALALCFTFNLVRKMSFIYPVPVLVFWVDLALTILSMIITGYVEGIHWYFPNRMWCILSSVIFIVSTVVDNLLCFYGYHYLPVSQVTLGVAPTTVFLYICQRTFLSSFHPGQGNVVEQVGIFIIVIGSMLSQFLAIFGDCRNMRWRTNTSQRDVRSSL